MDVAVPALAVIPIEVQAEARHNFFQRLPRNLVFFLLLTGFLLALFAVLRLGLILRTREPLEITWLDALPAFWFGARFDLATIGYFLAPVMALCYLPWTAPWNGRRRFLIFLGGLTLLITVMTSIAICEFEFYDEFQSRFNELAVRYFDHPKIVLSMIWYDYPVMLYLVAWLACGGVIFFILRYIMRIAFATAQSAGQRPGTWGEIGTALLVFATIAIACRGGFGGEPLSWGNAFQPSNPDYTNQMSLNGLWTLGQSFRDTFGRGEKAAGWTVEKKADESSEVVRRMLLSPREKLLDPARRTVLRRGDLGSSTKLVGKNGKPINVVIVMMESFSGRYCGALGAPKSFTPSFDALAKEGVLFDRTLSAGTHTHQGIFATLLGFPNLPGYETLMSSPISNQHFLSLPEIMEDQGYHTFFLYNGDFSWDNMRGFFTRQGVETFIGGDDMPEATYRDKVWGVSDEDLFNRCNKEFEAASKRGPFMAAVMTLSNHSPFDVPPVPGTTPITDHGEFNKRLEGQRYADYAVGKFIEKAKTLSYFENTLFVFVGDHGYHVPPVLTEVHLLYHHVPLLLFYAPHLMTEPRVDHRLAQQVNILPSVLGLLDLKEAQHASWGRSLFNDGFGDENFAMFKQSGGGRAVALARGDKLLLLGSASGKPLLMNFSLAWPPTISPLQDDELRVEMELELRSYIQAGLRDLKSQRAGPVIDDDK